MKLTSSPTFAFVLSAVITTATSATVGSTSPLLIVVVPVAPVPLLLFGFGSFVVEVPPAATTVSDLVFKVAV